MGFFYDYRASDTATALNAASNIVKATNQNCLQAKGGLGTFYADAITAAETALIAQQNARGGTNVLILLSDGAASSNSSQMGALETSNLNSQCHAAITAAQAAAKAGTWVYSIYYDDNGGNCNDTTAITSCSAMKQIASDPSKFFSTDGTTGLCPSTNPYTSISSILSTIGASVTTTRLLPNNTT